MRCRAVAVLGSKQVGIWPYRVGPAALQQFQRAVSKISCSSGCGQPVQNAKSQANAARHLRGQSRHSGGRPPPDFRRCGFQNLGLLIIDEEQRFEVKAKEKLKRFAGPEWTFGHVGHHSAYIAGPGFFGVRDLSLIETPPPDRRAIRTSIVQFDDDVIREAVLRELNRNGQVFFVHNRVRNHCHRRLPQTTVARSAHWRGPRSNAGA